nr:DUF87 domain-containing protein [Candidatus Sigynarchaeota archaeon]
MIWSGDDSTFNPAKQIKIGMYSSSRNAVPGKDEARLFTSIDIDDLVQHSNVFGITGTGKSYFISNLVNQLQRFKKGMIGILIINYGKKHQEVFFKPDLTLRYGDAGLSVPYFIMPLDKTEVKKYSEQSAHNIVATMGLKYAVKRILPIVMDLWWQQRGCLPASLGGLLNDLLRYIKAHPYAPEFQANLLQATTNRIHAIVSDASLINAVRLVNTTPDWFTQWLDGKTVFLDFSGCDSVAKQLLSYCVFQMVRALIPHDETNVLKHFIIIDEAHQILRKPLTGDPNDEDFITMVQTQTIFESLLKEFRSMGVGILIADQQPSSLISCSHSLASNKFIFRLNYPCNTLFFSNPDRRDDVLRLGDRVMLAMVNGRMTFIQTLESDHLLFAKVSHSDGGGKNGDSGKLLYLNVENFDKACGRSTAKDPFAPGPGTKR